MIDIKKLFSVFPKDLHTILENILYFPDDFKLQLERLYNYPGFNKIDDTYSMIKNSYVHVSTKIGDFTLIRDSYISSKCRIGSHVEINNSIILSGVVIPHHNYIGYSIIGNNVVMGGNTRTTVRRLDGNNPRIIIDDCTYEAQCIKYGSLIGDNSKIGSSVVFGPMAILGRNVIVEPNMTICGFFPNNTYLKNSNKAKGTTLESGTS